MKMNGILNGLQRTRRSRVRSDRSLGSPLNARPLGVSLEGS
jgi:hypothetical protein